MKGLKQRDCRTRPPEQKAAQSDNLAAFAAYRRGLRGRGCPYARCRSLQTISHYGMGSAKKPGHYLDLLSAVLGCTPLPLGFLGNAIARWKNAN
jgi:hypothetical protein